MTMSTVSDDTSWIVTVSPGGSVGALPQTWVEPLRSGAKILTASGVAPQSVQIRCPRVSLNDTYRIALAPDRSGSRTSSGTAPDHMQCKAVSAHGGRGDRRKL